MDQDTWLQFAGRLHPLLLHLPIGLWLGIAVLEFGGALVRRAPGRATLSILTWVAALGGAFSAGTGWLLAREGYDTETVDLHRWLGVGAAGLGLFAACFSAMTSRGAFRLLLSVEVVVLMAAGHLGSQLTHGTDWLLAPFERTSQPAAPADGAETPGPTTAPNATIPPTPADPAANVAPAGDPPTAPATGTFAVAVQPILARYCTQCHGTQKQKGDLALHERATIEKGGEGGPVVVAGRPEVSPLFTNLLLPIDHDDHMPPDGKKQPTAAEIEVLRAWIAAGAPFEGTGAAQPVPGETGKPPAEPQQDPKPSPTPAPGAGEPKESTPLPAGGNGAQPAGGTVPPTPAPVPTPAPTPTPGGAGDEPPTDDFDAVPTTPAPAADPAVAAVVAQPAEEPAPALTRALAALHKRQVHAARIALDQNGLCVDFGPVATSTTADEVRTLLMPVGSQVEDLSLARVPVNDQLLSAVAGLPRLRRLDLRSTSTTTDWLRPFVRSARLEELVLASTRLDDRAADLLLQMPALKTVYVWDSGLSPTAIQRLREREGLRVDAGDEPARTAMPPDMPTPTTVEQQPKADAAVADALAPRNAVCPVSQKPVDPRYVIVHEQRAVGFCCPNCPKAFWQEPAKYPVADR